EDGIRDGHVTGVQTCALPISSPSFLVAAFHPGAPETFTTPPQLVSFLRRTPDPTLQLVRTSVLRRATGEGPRVSDDVTRRNFERSEERRVGKEGRAVWWSD